HKEKQWAWINRKLRIGCENDDIQSDSPNKIEGWEVTIKKLNESSNITEDFFNE
ncbi:11833_t:CDS:1, partial [Dentiscutata erythropus]